jgi:toxin ParE1/3/4
LSVPRKRWQVRLTASAEADVRQIVRWTADHFGARQARVYARTLSLAIEALTAGPDVVGVRRRDEIARGLCSLHVARGGRRGRHLVIFRSGKDGGQRAIEVLRVLHDSMDLPQHLAGD